MAAGKTIVTLSGEDAELYRSFQRILDQQAKTVGGYGKVAAASKAAAAEAKKAAKETADAEKDRQRTIDGLAGSVAGMVTTYVSLQGAVNLVTAAHTKMVERQSEALDLAKQIAAAQQEAAKNMAGQSPAQLDEVFTEKLQYISRETGFKDLNKLTTAMGSAASIVGPEAAPGVVEAAARVTRFTPEELQKTTTATADIMAATGLKDAEQALAMLASTGSVARPEQLAKLATGSAIVANAAVTSAPNQDPVAAASEAISVYAKLSKVDPEGQSSATATVQLIKQISDAFTDTKQIRERDTKISALADAAPENKIAIARAEMKVEETRQRAAAFQPGDTSLPARDASLDLQSAELALAAAAKKSAEDAKELERLTTIRAAVGVAMPADKRAALEQRQAELQQTDKQLMQAANAGTLEQLPAALKTDSQNRMKALGMDPAKREDITAFAMQQFGTSADESNRINAELAAAKQSPDTFETRLARVQQVPELKQQISEGLTGEAKFQPLMRDLLDGSSKFSAEVAEARKAINTNPESFRAVANTTVQTNQAKIAAAGEQFEASKNIAQTFDTESQIRQAVANIASQAMATTDRGMGNFLQSTIATTERGVSSMVSSTPGFVQGQEKNLEVRLKQLQQSGAEPNQIEVIAVALKTIAELGAMAPATRGQSPDEMAKYLTQQAALQEKTNQLLQEIRDGQPARNQAPPGRAIRESATNPVFEGAR
jgi:hypothetical protein